MTDAPPPELQELWKEEHRLVQVLLKVYQNRGEGNIIPPIFGIRYPHSLKVEPIGQRITDWLAQNQIETIPDEWQEWRKENALSRFEDYYAAVRRAIEELISTELWRHVPRSDE